MSYFPTRTAKSFKGFRVAISKSMVDEFFREFQYLEWARPETLGWVHGRREVGLKAKQCCPEA